MSYLDKLRAQISEKGLPDQPPEPPKLGFGGFGGNPKGHVSPNAVVKEWRGHLARLGVGVPGQGLDRGRWGQLVADADWLLDNFGEQAARDGWSAIDLFGVLPGRDGWGGIADRLCASRSLVMGAEVARWRRVINGEPESFARGLGETVRMVPLWECK